MTRPTSTVEDAPRLALTVTEAVKALGISRSTFDRRVKPRLRVVIEGSRILVPVSELERYLDERAT